MARSIALSLSLLTLLPPQTVMAVGPVSAETASVLLGTIAVVYFFITVGLAVCIMCILCGKQDGSYKPSKSPAKKGEVRHGGESSQGNHYQLSPERGSLELTTFKRVSNDMNGTQPPVYSSARKPQSPAPTTPQFSAVSRNRTRTSYEDTLRTSTFITAEYVDIRGVPEEGAVFENKLFQLDSQKSLSSSGSQPSDDVFPEPVVKEDQPSPLPPRDEIKRLAQQHRRLVGRTPSTKPLLNGSESEDGPCDLTTDDVVLKPKVGRTLSTKPLLLPSESEDVSTPSPMEDVAVLPEPLHRHTPAPVSIATEGHTYSSPSHDIARERPRPSPAHRRVSPAAVGVPVPPVVDPSPVHNLAGDRNSLGLLAEVMKVMGDHPTASTEDPLPSKRLATDL